MNGRARNAGDPKTAWIALFGAMSATVLIYGAIAFTLGPPGEPPETARPVRMALWGVALVLLFAAQRIVAPFRKEAAGTAASGTAASGRAAAGPLAAPRLPEPSGVDPMAFGRRSVLALALTEAASIVGLVLVFVGGGRSDFLLLGALTLLVNFAIILPAGLAFSTTATENRPS